MGLRSHALISFAVSGLGKASGGLRLPESFFMPVLAAAFFTLVPVDFGLAFLLDA